MIRVLFSVALFLVAASQTLAQNPRLYDPAAAFFDDSAVREVRLYFTDSDWYNKLVQAHQNQAQTGDPFFPCRFKWGSVDLPQVGCRFKGNSSFRRNGIKRPFKLDFNEFDANTNFLGLTKLNLQTNDLQPDFLREKLVTEFAGKFVAAARTVHVRVYVNDAYYGLYTAMEQPDKSMMESRFGNNEDGNLYEANEILGAPDGGAVTRPDLAWLGTAAEPYRRIYELETNQEANDYSGLIEFLNILNNTPTAELPAKLEAVADVEQMLTWLAINNLFVNLDSYLADAGEYYLYERTRDGRFIYTQWDQNESFGTTGDGTVRIQNPFVFDVFWLPGNGVGAQNQRPLIQKTLAAPEYRRLYLRIFARLLREGFDPQTFSARITQMANLIREHVYADPNKVTTNQQFETALNDQTMSGTLPLFGLNQFVRERYNYLRPWLNSQAQAADVRLNEIVATNNGQYKDGAGDADPWIELHNLGPGPVTLTNFYLTDDPASPTKWALPARTLADGEYLVLWLDGETTEGDTHANFRLQTAGGRLFLTQGTGGGTTLDSVTYPGAADGQAYTRLGSYGSRWAQTFQPTPLTANPMAGSSTAQPPSTGTGQLLINEIMADNDEIYPDPDEPGAYNDWFEIFNPGTTAVDMSGMFITDNLSSPTKWQVPAGVTIPARGYLVFIADDETAQGRRHTNFKLSEEGEELGIFAADGKTLIDSRKFGLQQEDVSLGRVTDGDGAWAIFKPATPGAANTAGYVNWITNAASFNLASVAAESIVSAFGANLTGSTIVPTTTPLPTTLGGVTITVTDKNNVARAAPLFFVSGGQINFQVPAGTATGRGKIALQRQDGTTISGDLLIEKAAPGLFAANADGQGVGAFVALRVAADGTQTYLPTFRLDAATNRFVAAPLSLGAETDRVYLILYGTGIRNEKTLSDVSVEVGGQAVPVLFSDAQGSLVGLDQVNIGPLPRTLLGKGAVKIVMAVNGRDANQLTITIQ
ncbi:MAG: CotH kinase family protein [Blastocatellia bacterium]|nr:CotH kinase family protein [Blastocatellia bacterium]